MSENNTVVGNEVENTVENNVENSTQVSENVSVGQLVGVTVTPEAVARGEAKKAKKSTHQKMMEVYEEHNRGRYPNINFKDGSFDQHEDHHVFGKKIFCTVICDCGAEVPRATSDLWSFKGCPDCKDVNSKLARLEKKLAKLRKDSEEEGDGDE